MEDLFARTVFFSSDAPRSLAFYTERLGFELDWNFEHEGRAFIFQVSLQGFSLIVNQAEGWTEARPGCGRVFVGLDHDQAEFFRRHLKQFSIATQVTHWGEPTIVIQDPDGNELFFWYPEDEREELRRDAISVGELKS